MNEVDPRLLNADSSLWTKDDWADLQKIVRVATGEAQGAEEAARQYVVYTFAAQVARHWTNRVLGGLPSIPRPPEMDAVEPIDLFRPVNEVEAMEALAQVARAYEDGRFRPNEEKVKAKITKWAMDIAQPILRKWYTANASFIQHLGRCWEAASKTTASRASLPSLFDGCRLSAQLPVAQEDDFSIQQIRVLGNLRYGVVDEKAEPFTPETRSQAISVAVASYRSTLLRQAEPDPAMAARVATAIIHGHITEVLAEPKRQFSGAVQTLADRVRSLYRQTQHRVTQVVQAMTRDHGCNVGLWARFPWDGTFAVCRIGAAPPEDILEREFDPPQHWINAVQLQLWRIASPYDKVSLRGKRVHTVRDVVQAFTDLAESHCRCLRQWQQLISDCVRMFLDNQEAL
jgi:hypothetical protein